MKHKHTLLFSASEVRLLLCASAMLRLGVTSDQMRTGTAEAGAVFDIDDAGRMHRVALTLRWEDINMEARRRREFTM